MIEFKYKIDFTKGEHGIETFNKEKAVQGECAMALLALERLKQELLNMDFKDASFEIDKE